MCSWLADQAWRRTPEGRQIDPANSTVAVLDDMYPLSYWSNRIIRTAPLKGTDDADLVMAQADQVLGAAGLAHRQITVMAAVAPMAVAELEAAGYATQRLSLMASSPSDVMSATLLAGRADHRVREVEEDALGPFLAAEWREELPDADEETIAQLIGRRKRMDRAALIVRMAAFGDGEAGHDPQILGHVDLIIRDGIAEIEEISVISAARGQGVGDSLLLSSAEITGKYGNEHMVLIADKDDWPLQWYRRRGFVELGEAWEFTRAKRRNQA